MLIGCFGSTQWTGEYCGLSLKGVKAVGVQEKRSPILATKRHKSHKDFFYAFRRKSLWAEADACEDVGELALGAEPYEDGVYLQVH